MNLGLIPVLYMTNRGFNLVRRDHMLPKIVYHVRLLLNRLDRFFAASL